jgi:hypothetical protein
MFAAHNNFPTAETYFDRALELYEHEWGSIAKYSWLKLQVTKILSDHGQTQQSPLWGTRIEVPTTTEEVDCLISKLLYIYCSPSMNSIVLKFESAICNSIAMLHLLLSWMRAMEIT